MMPRLLRYAIVGVAATAAHYALLVVAVEVGHWPAWLASGAGAVFGAQVAWLGNRAFTFAHRGALGASWWRFQIAAALGAAAGMAIVAATVALGVHYLVGQVVATVAVMLGTYAINARWTFAARPGPG
jgi:putative flippase GtrA